MIQEHPELMTESIRCWCGAARVIKTWANPRILSGECFSVYNGFCETCGRDVKGIMYLGEFPGRVWISALVGLWDCITRQSFESRRRKWK